MLKLDPHILQKLEGQHQFRLFICGNCGHTHRAPLYCGDRFCDVCGKFRRFKARRRMEFVITNTPIPAKYFWRHITLTIPNVADPATGFDLLKDSFRRLRQRSWWKRVCSHGMYTYEVTGSEGNWHVHIHALVLSQWIQFRFLKRQWTQTVIGKAAYTRMVKTWAEDHPFDPDSEPGYHVYLTQPKLSIILGHLVKYINSPGDDSCRDAWKQSEHLKSARLYNTFGHVAKVPADIDHPSRPCEKCGAIGQWTTPDSILWACRRAGMFGATQLEAFAWAGIPPPDQG